MRDELTNHGMGNASERRGPCPRRRQIGEKLLEVSAVVQNRMRRGILHRVKVFKILRHRFFHSPPQLPRYSIGAHKSAGSEIKAPFLLAAGRSGLGRHRHRSFLRLCLRLRFGDKLLPITTFFEASVYGADLGALLDDERRAALRARFGDGHVGGGEIAIRVAGATDEFAEPAALLHEILAAQGAEFSERLIGLVRDARALDQAAGGLAVRVTGAGEERAEAAALDGHLLAAIVAILDFRLAAGLLGKFRGEVLNEIAFGIARTAQKEAVA